MPRLVVIGHLATNESVTPHGSHVGLGGSACYFVNGACVMPRECVGVVACVGADLELTPVRQLADLAGVTVATEPSAHFVLRQADDGTRTFEANWGAAQHVDLDYPKLYCDALHVHLATAPPAQQSEWLRRLRRTMPTASVSVDAFEEFARRWPNETRTVLATADLAFLNDEEFELIDDSRWWRKTPFVNKHGKGGATYRDIPNEREIRVDAEPAEPVDTTGAGDVLAGSFLALRAAGWAIRDALEIAVSLASVSVQEFGMGALLHDRHRELRARVREGPPS
jgi:sugar/nucleoside kinase (ribokinase family)